MTASLIVTVDTEEDGAWNGGFPRSGQTVKNVAGIERFQAVCDALGVRPTYLIDAPVVLDEQAAARLRAIHESGRCEIGAHLHPWCTPPLVEELGARNSFLCNLPANVQREKIVWMTDAIAEKVGRRPTSFRAGRYGLDVVGAEILRELRYSVDSSVMPLSDYSGEQGPNFESAPFSPYYVGTEDLCVPSLGPPRAEAAAGHSLLEVPISVGFSRPDFDRARSLRRMALRPWLRRCRAVGVLDRLGIARRIKFSPEQAGPRRLKQLVRACLARSAPVMVMSLHSSSLIAGGSPYVRTSHDLETLLRTLESTLAFCLRDSGMIPMTLAQFAADWCGDAP